MIEKVRIAYRFDIMMYDRPFVEVSSDIMGGRTDHFHAARMGLVIGLGALETRQETTVNDDAAATQISGKSVRKNLHIAGKHNERRAGFVNKRRDTYLLLRLTVMSDRQIMIRAAIDNHKPELIKRQMG